MGVTERNKMVTTGFIYKIDIKKEKAMLEKRNYNKENRSFKNK